MTEAFMNKFVVIVFALISIQLSAAGQVMYQWRDKNNTLHVSQLPPQNMDYETIVIGSSQQTAAATPKNEPVVINAEQQQSCDKAKKNLKILEQDLPVFFDLEDGSKQQLTDTQMEEQRKLAHKQIEYFCETAAGSH
jgi:hypothetical protein